MGSKNAYQDLKPFDHFVGQAFDPQFYVKVPSDWLVVVADITCSTSAIANGQYEDVNFIGAGCVVALTNAVPDTAIPTVFGGDGASAAVPTSFRPDIETALRQMRDWTQNEFGLELRIGVIPVSVLEEKGATLEMGKMQLGAGNVVAMFRGSALDIADDLLKNDTDFTYQLPHDSQTSQAPDLSDLSCRWSPIKPQSELMLCLIIGARDPLKITATELDTLYSEVIHKINRIVNLEDPDTNPVKLSNLEFKIQFPSILREIKALSGNAVIRALRTLAINLVARFLFLFKLKVGDFDAERYRHEITLNSDFIKVNGMIRMIIDCNQQQSNQIEQLLEGQHRAGEVVFGLHRADQAMMTCVTPDITNGKHLHYIDATDGGFWSAASNLKERMKNKVQTVTTS